MYASIINFIYFKGKYRKNLLFLYIFKGENNTSIYFPL